MAADDENAVNPEDPNKETLTRDIRVNDIRDLNELLKLPNPMRPSEEIQLRAVTLDDGTRIDRPLLNDLKKLRPTRLRPVTFHWEDSSKVQTMAPKKYDDIIRRLLNAGPADMEDLVRANWQKFDKAFFFRLTELREDTTDERLKEKINNLEKISLDIVAAAQNQVRKSMPEYAADARELLSVMLEGDGQTLLWPPTADSYARLADAIALRATRAKYDDSWFESMMEMVERYAKKMEVKQEQQLMGMGLIILQRLVTEWLRHDSLWEETGEGQFIYRLLTLDRLQWEDQLLLEQEYLDAYKLRDELKIISESKVVALPMGSKLQLYAAKYLQELANFVEKKDEILQQRGAAVGR